MKIKGYRIDYTGDSEMMVESFGYALQSLILAIVLIYAILASQFRSFLQPLAIMLSLPLSLLGVAGMLYAAARLTHLWNSKKSGRPRLQEDKPFVA